MGLHVLFNSRRDMAAFRTFSVACRGWKPKPVEIEHKDVQGKDGGRRNKFLSTTHEKLSYLLTYGAEPSLRSCQLCSYLRASQHFMEPEGSLPRSQEPSTGPYPEQIDPVHTIPSYRSKVRIIIKRG
jgi:hypothetical protein